MRPVLLSAVIAVATALTFTTTAADAATAGDPDTDIYIATPRTGCDDANTGATKDEPICTFARAEKLLNTAYAAGDARGDVYLRLASGPDATRTPATRGESSTLNYAPAANTTLHIVPDWYERGLRPDPRAGRDFVYWAGNGDLNNAARGNVANHVAFTVSPRENRGGTYHIYGQDVTGFVKGIVVNGRVKYTGTARDNLRGEGVLLPNSAPIDGMVIDHNRFHQIGSRYATATRSNGKHIAESGNAALHFWNSTNTLVEHNTFTDIYNTVGAGLGHVIYAYTSSYATVRDNTFTNSNLTVVHRRMSHGWTVTGNDFGPGLSRAHNSTWYRAGARFDDDGRLAECRYAMGRTDTGENSEFLLPQQSWCADTRRVYAPRDVTYIIGDNTVTATWSHAVTNGQKLAGYTLEVTDSRDNVVDSVDVGPYANTATVPLDRPGLRVGLIARGESGHHTGSSTLRVTTDPQRSNYSVTVGSWDRPVDETRTGNTGRTVTPPRDTLSSVGSAESVSLKDTLISLIRYIISLVLSWF